MLYDLQMPLPHHAFFFLGRSFLQDFSALRPPQVHLPCLVPSRLGLSVLAAGWRGESLTLCYSEDYPHPLQHDCSSCCSWVQLKNHQFFREAGWCLKSRLHQSQGVCLCEKSRHLPDHSFPLVGKKRMRLILQGEY